jgi:hypothetical protein
MKNFGEIRVTQRTAVGHDDSDRTTLFVVKGCYGRDDIGVMSHRRAKEFETYADAEIIGTVTIIHPWLLWGTWEENIGDFVRIALDKLERDGFLTNDYGTYFLAKEVSL